MRRLSNLFKSAAAALGIGPRAICRVEGFDLSIEKKDGFLLTTANGQPASKNGYYEVKIRPNGDHAEYPAANRESVQRYTVGLAGQGLGFINDVAFVPAGSKFQSFELVEVFDDGRHTMGHRMPPHHSVMLQAHFRDASGSTSKISMGGWVRKSETETAAWKQAQKNPVMWM